MAVLLLGAMPAGCSHNPDRPRSTPSTSTAATSTATTTTAPATILESTTAAPTSPTTGTTPPTVSTPRKSPSGPPSPRGLPPSSQPVSAGQLGASWHPGCPVGPAGLRLVRLDYRGFDGRQHAGQLVVAATLAGQVLRIFAELDAAGFPIRRMVPVSAYGGDDERSMEADNSSAFNCRPITGGSGWSEHAYGTAIDLNPRENPYVSASGVQPTTAQRFTDRDRTDPGMIHPDDRTVTIFARYGWSWGGAWTEPRDYQHFEK